MLVTRHPDGRLLGLLRSRYGSAWLDLEATTFREGVSGAAFVLRGRAAKQTEYHVIPWEEAVGRTAHVVTFDMVVRRNVDLILFLRKQDKAREESYARIPARVRR